MTEHEDKFEEEEGQQAPPAAPQMPAGLPAEVQKLLKDQNESITKLERTVKATRKERDSAQGLLRSERIGRYKASHDLSEDVLEEFLEGVPMDKWDDRVAKLAGLRGGPEGAAGGSEAAPGAPAGGVTHLPVPAEVAAADAFTRSAGGPGAAAPPAATKMKVLEVWEKLDRGEMTEAQAKEMHAKDLIDLSP